MAPATAETTTLELTVEEVITRDLVLEDLVVTACDMTDVLCEAPVAIGYGAAMTGDGV